jgi:hypothetical protein
MKDLVSKGHARIRRLIFVFEGANVFKLFLMPRFIVGSLVAVCGQVVDDAGNSIVFSTRRASRYLPSRERLFEERFDNGLPAIRICANADVWEKNDSATRA